MIQLAGALALLAIVFLFGAVVGFFASRVQMKRWFDENGCYLCNERFKAGFGLDVDAD